MATVNNSQQQDDLNDTLPCGQIAKNPVEPDDMKFPPGSFSPEKKKRKIKKQPKSYLKRKFHRRTYRIPKAKLDHVLELLNSSDARFGNEVPVGCHLPIHLKREPVTNQCHFLLIEARNALLRRDWKNLAKILSAAKPLESDDYAYYYSHFVKYAAICLKHNEDLGLMKNFFQGVLYQESDNIDNMNVFWNKLTSVSNNQTKRSSPIKTRSQSVNKTDL